MVKYIMLIHNQFDFREVYARLPIGFRILDFGISSCIFCICLIEYRLEDVEKKKTNA